MKMYPRRKESFAPWLGEIPDHWEECLIKRLIISRYGGAWGTDAKSNSMDRYCMRVADFDFNTLRFNKKPTSELTIRNYTEDQINKLILSSGDILVEKSGGGDKAPVGRAVLFDLQISALFANFMDLIKVDSSSVLPEYFVQFWASMYHHRINCPYIKQTTGIQNLDLAGLISNELIAVPTMAEQDQIVRFLDWKVSGINRLINIRKKQIEKLEDLKKAVIASAVTHGLNPKASRKDSGLKWIGKIPEHWEILKLKQILSSFSEKKHPDMPLLSVVREKGVIVRNVEEKDENHNYVPDDLTDYKLVKRGQFVINKMKAWQGSCGVSKYDGIVSPAYFIFDITHNMNEDFFNKAIRSKIYVSYFGQASDGIRVGQWDLSMKRMKEIPFIIPPLAEQDRIVAYLDKQTKRIDSAMLNKQAQIKTLQELKTRLISDVVTGKMDVRGIEIPEYELVEEEAVSDAEDAEGEEVCEETESAV